jgi:hypothetical protein
MSGMDGHGPGDSWNYTDLQSGQTLTLTIVSGVT